jgi:phage-related protein
MVYRFTVEASVSRRAGARIEAIRSVFTGPSITTWAVSATIEVTLTIYSLHAKQMFLCAS